MIDDLYTEYKNLMVSKMKMRQSHDQIFNHNVEDLIKVSGLKFDANIVHPMNRIMYEYSDEKKEYDELSHEIYELSEKIFKRYYKHFLDVTKSIFYLKERHPTDEDIDKCLKMCYEFKLLQIKYLKFE